MGSEDRNLRRFDRDASFRREATVTIGLILPMTGPSASTGKQERAAAELYIQQHGDAVAGKKISWSSRTTPAPPTSPSASRRN